MSRTCCLAGITQDKVAVLVAALKSAGARPPPKIARLSVSDLRSLLPDLLVCDIDLAERDRLELVRQIRFVLPGSIIAIYTGVATQSWALSCHLAGANCILSKKSTERQLACGLRDAMRFGCFTDPRFYAA